LGTSNAYLLKAECGYVLVDAGNKGREKHFFAVLEQHHISPQDICLIFITHVHFDHIGGLEAIQARTQAPVMVHALERNFLEEGIVTIPRGTMALTRLTSRLGKRLASRLQFSPCKVDYVVDEDQSLSEFGLAAQVVQTPGHTTSSISILTAAGDAFVGDLCHNAFPFGLGPIFPPFADDVPALYASWRRLLALNVQTIYPGHSAPFPVEALRAKLPRNS
jgi:glyoxylase-like metal-dependent hydrolase (beta-lactamase superfamily II)